jgi:hypothetical protein
MSVMSGEIVPQERRYSTPDVDADGHPHPDPARLVIGRASRRRRGAADGFVFADLLPAARS